MCIYYHMVSHRSYRNHIVRNARRRKKAFATAVASGDVGITGNVPYDDIVETSPKSRPRPAAPIFVHSTYSSLSHVASELSRSSYLQSHEHYNSDRLHPQESLRTSAGPSARRGPSASPLLGAQLLQPSSALSSSRPTYLNLSNVDPRDAVFIGPPSASSTASFPHLGPPLASPSVMDRPHTATTSFFPPNISGGVTIQPPQLIHRHSYSALGSQPVLEPITPTSELPHYPYHYYPTSPAPTDPGVLYSPTLTASPHLIGGSATTPTTELGTYFQAMHGSGPSLYPDRYGPPQARGPPSATYPPSHPHSHSHSHSQTHQTYPVHPHNTAPVGRSAVSHSSLGSHNPLLSGLELGDDSLLSTSSRSTSLAGSPAQHFSIPSESFPSDSAQYTTHPSASSSSAPPARWLKSPGTALEFPPQYPHSQSHHTPASLQTQGHGLGWQPDVGGDFAINSATYQAPLDASVAEERAYRMAVMEEKGYEYQQQNWSSYDHGA